MRLKRGEEEVCSYNFFVKNKRGQLAIFIILAILIVSIAALFFIFKDKLMEGRMPHEMEPVYNSLKFCLEEDLALGVKVLESQGGYIYLPEYEEGSEYMPFSSRLDFLGNPIPYWYYVSGNNIQREQVPTIKDMENEIERFIESKIRTCYFDDYYMQGYEITMEKPNASVTLTDNDVILNLIMEFSILKGDESYVVREHKVILDSELGSLYKAALNVYEEEHKTLFLEKYGVDVLRLYAPVDGVEMTCSPMIWNAQEVFDELKNAVEANTLAIKNAKNKKEYFEVELPEVPSDYRVRFLNSQNWTHTYEVNPSKEAIMIANPVGNQQGLGILGFCYVPYHFVYDMKYPVLVQVISGKAANEIFQFPMAVVIDRNKPREAFTGEILEQPQIELCKDKNTEMSIRLYDSNLKPVEGYISYECLGAKCNIGTTKNGRLSEEFPQCVNGFINVRADGYKEESIMYSIIKEGDLNFYLTKLSNLSVQLRVDNQAYNKEAIIYFVSDDFSKTVLYPQQKYVELAEGEYEIQVYIYKNSSLKLGATTQQQCVEVPRSSIGGILGLMKKECIDVKVPAQVISSVLSAGGKLNYSFSESDLKKFKTITINAESLPNPTSLDQVQTNYIIFESKELDIDLK